MGSFQFEIIINVIVSPSRFILIPMLWVYGHYNFFMISVQGSTLDVKIWRLQMSVQNLTSKVDPRAEKSQYLLT